MKEQYGNWLINVARKSNGEKYKPNSIKHYWGTIDVLNKEFNIDLYSINNLTELEKIKNKLYENKLFIQKNSRGNCMYSRAIETYIKFVEYRDVNYIVNDIKNSFKRKIHRDISVEEKDKYIESTINIRNPGIQRRFRNELLDVFDGKCALCDINDKRLLIASHIIPYSKCINKSDLYESYNGLLLCTIHDALFDKHLITFLESGKIRISKSLDKSLYSFFNINNEMILKEKYLTEQRKKTLMIHNKEFENRELNKNNQAV